MIARRTKPLQKILTILSLVVMAVALLVGTASPAQADTSDEAAFFDVTNSYRNQNGLASFQWDQALSNIARGWSQQMANTATLSHNGNLTAQVNSSVTTQWTRLGENVGFGPSVSAIQGAFINSSPHRANILGDYNRVGIGAVRDSSGRIWVTLDFLKGPSLGTTPPPVTETANPLSPASTSWQSGRTDIFKRNTDGALWSKTFSGSSWSSWISLGGAMNSEPAATSWGDGRIDVFVRGTDNAIWHRALANGTWSGWDSLGGRFTSGAGAVSWGTNRIDVFGRGSDGALWGNAWTGTSWTGWYTLGGAIKMTPQAASWGAGRLDLLAIGTDNAVWHKVYWAGRWSGWESLGGSFTSAAAGTSWGWNRLDVFTRGPDNAVWGKAWDGTKWSAWYPLGGKLSSAPAVSSPGSWKLSVIGRGGDGAIWQRTFNGGAWSAWLSLG